MKSKKNKAFAFVIIFFWGALTLWNLFTPAREFSEAENRVLHQIPEYSSRDYFIKELLDGKYMNAVNEYLNDQFAVRDVWVGAQSLMEYGLGKREINGIYIGDNAMYGHLSSENPLFAEGNIAGVNSFAARFGIPTTVALVPSSASVQPAGLPAFATSWDEEAFIDRVYAELHDGIATVDIFGALIKHSDEYIYYRTDHHWTTYGAWLGYQSIADAMGVPVRGQSEFEISAVSDSFYGTYHSKTGLYFIEQDSMEAYESGSATRLEVRSGSTVTEYGHTFFEEFLGKKDKYSYFLGTVQPVINIYTDAGTSKKLVIFKDSYAHCFAPMLFADYSEICLVDLRSYNSPDYANDLGIENFDQALFLYSADTFGHDSGTSLLQF